MYLKTQFGNEIVEMPYEERDGVFFSVADSYGRKDMSSLACKALDMMAETDITLRRLWRRGVR